MDLDAYVTAHHGEWARLEQLSGQRRLTGTEADEMLDLYQRVATHLSEVRTRSPEPTLVAHLSSLLARTRLRSAGTRTFAWSDVVRFLTVTFPAALFHTRRWWLTTLVVNVAAAFVMGWWLVAHPSLENSLLSPQEVQQLVDSDFASYYTEYAAGSFAFKIWTNNAWVTALCLALGVFGVPVVYLLFQNIVNVAVIGGIMWTHGRADLFFGLILPHGMLELTCVFVAAGAGLRIFWAWSTRDRAPAAGPSPRRAGRPVAGPRARARPARHRHHRGVRHAVAAADVGADRLSACSPRSPSSPTSSPSAVGRAARRDRGPRARDRGDTAPVV